MGRKGRAKNEKRPFLSPKGVAHGRIFLAFSVFLASDHPKKTIREESRMDIGGFVVESWEWFVNVYNVMNRGWLGLGIVLSVLLGVAASRAVEQSGLIWKTIVIVLVSGGLFAAFLAFAQLSPETFNVEGLARSQVSI